MFKYLIFTLLVIHPIDEYHHCLNPEESSENKYIVCNWDKNDFEVINSRKVLKHYNKNDNKIKAKFRRRHVLQHK